MVAFFDAVSPKLLPKKVNFVRSVSPTQLEEGELRAEDIFRALLPRCSSVVMGRLRREGVTSARDLARLHRDDLLDLGLTMVERSRVLAWAQGEIEVPRAGMHDSPEQDEENQGEGGSPNCEDDTQVQRRLDEAEQNADFWCGLVTSTSNREVAKLRAQAEFNDNEDLSDVDVQSVFSFDVRENVLEMLFDLTPERVQKVYDSIDRDADGRISAAELGRGLQEYRLPALSAWAVEQILERVPTYRDGCLRLAEFEAVLSRLKLAQLLNGITQALSDNDSSSSKQHLMIVDYTPANVNVDFVSAMSLRDYFFGHRPRSPAPEPTTVRWVHSNHLDLTLLLALTVKYSLHPLSVEDVIEQSPTKIDRNGNHYFVAIEVLRLAGSHDGSQPVNVHGRHVTMFCAGPPRFDTVITVSQVDRSFQNDWPGGIPIDRVDEDDEVEMWVERLQDRLRAPLSRLRERRTDYLMHQVLDLCTDDLVAVVRAYTKRLQRLEVELHEQGATVPSEWPSEVLISRMQLMVVARRVRGLQRLLRQVVGDPDLNTNGLQSYFQDVGDHLNEAYDDAGQLIERCSAIVSAHERIVERSLERSQQTMADRLNKTLFILTVFTTIFAPMQFLVGVYGMNFVDGSGQPSIPELKWHDGYWIFWYFVAGYMLVCATCASCLFRSLNRRRKTYKQKKDEHGTMKSGSDGTLRAASKTSALPMPLNADASRRRRSFRSSALRCSVM